MATFITTAVRTSDPTIQYSLLNFLSTERDQQGGRYRQVEALVTINIPYDSLPQAVPVPNLAAAITQSV
jgi:hypothetical protein